jgi:acetoin:2,6-dichlorophenolindophenol oxidoreductase subunit beta
VGKAVTRREGSDVTIVSAGVSVHRALQAADGLQAEGISTCVLDLRTISPLDRGGICDAVRRTGRLLVVDEDYEGFGLSGEIAAVCLEEGLAFQFGRVCTQKAIPYAQKLEYQVLPNVERICAGVKALL